jgi:hypothetical protein
MKEKTKKQYEQGLRREEVMKVVTLAVLALAMLALAFVGCDREITGDVAQASNASEDCFSCHSDRDVFLKVAQQQFENSVHAAGRNSNRNRLYSPGYQSCEQCHTHEGFVAKWAGIPASGENFTPFKCFTCHAPHTNADFRLRVEQAVELENGTFYNKGHSNVCAACHHSRADVNTFVVDDVELSEHWGPHHSVQSDMLAGTNGYEYAAFDNYDGSYHETGVTDGCPSCHMGPSEHESIGGHSWNMENEDRGFQEIAACNVEGCHFANKLDSLNRIANADFDGDGVTEGVQDEIDGLLDSLGTLLQNAGLLTVDLEPVDELIVPDADSAGALFNYLFVHEDRSEGIHNTDYAVKLLVSSINYIETGDPTGGTSPANDPRLARAH